MDANLSPCAPVRTGRLGADVGRAGSRPRRRHRVFQGPRRPDALSDSSRSRTAARADGRPRPRPAGAPAGDEQAVDARTPNGSSRRCASPATSSVTAAGEYRLSPKAMRQLGKALLRDVAERMSGRQGSASCRAGAAGDLSGATRRVELRRHRAPGTSPHDAQRRAAESRAFETPRARRPLVRSPVDDIEVQETEARTQAAVALLVDTSFSMAMDGRWCR